MGPKKFLMLLSAAALLQPAAYFVVTRSASYLFHVNLVSESTFPYRDANIYYLWPSKRGNLIFGAAWMPPISSSRPATFFGLRGGSDGEKV
jgi:hypothetical protein